MYNTNAALKGSVYENILKTYFLVFSHFWLATPQEVLQADWQEVWHSPQPPFLTVSVIFLVSIVLILLIIKLLLKISVYF